MKGAKQVRFLTVALLWGALASGGATAASTSCRPGELTMACCIKKFPLSPRESCAASDAEALLILKGIRMAIEEGELANSTELPAWKQECIQNYVHCVDDAWGGPCYDCLRRCEGQYKWPAEMCPPPEEGK